MDPFQFEQQRLLGLTVPTSLYYTLSSIATRQFYVGVSLAINNATEPGRRGELNGLTMTVDSLARSISPIVCSSLFAFSIHGNNIFPFDYHLVFYLLALVRLAVAGVGWNGIHEAASVGNPAAMLKQ